MPTPIWRPGESPYAEWLKNRTPEELAAHKIQRAQKKSMKKAFDKVVQAQQEIWISRINEGLLAVLKKAVETGDSNAIAVVFDRVIGKPVDTITTDDDRILPWSNSDTLRPNDKPDEIK